LSYRCVFSDVDEILGNECFICISCYMHVL
jgi:hypothetical protein